ncbi:PepSY domain-containing protein [Bradyrhizobium sp. UFLA05-109]
MRGGTFRMKTAAIVKPAPLYAAFWRWHFLAALIVIPFVLWQSTTGTLYLWSEWWTDVRYPQLRFVPVSDAAAAPSVQIRAAFSATSPRPASTDGQSQHEGHENHASMPMMVDRPVQQIVLSDDPRRSTAVIMQDPGGLPYPVFVDPHAGSVLGTLTPSQWLPGITRALHAGWPLGKPGNWFLELGDCWAIVMIVTGLYLWWPRGRRFSQALCPRFSSGPRLLLRDLHATVAVVISGVFLFFLISALPWTAFWGGEVLSRAQSALGQENPAGFSIGGAAAAQLTDAGASIDAVARAARDRGVTGAIAIQLSPWRDAPLFVTNRTSSLSEDRIITADPATGDIRGDFRHADLPIIPRIVAVGIHVHQGDFGPVNLWLNTLLAVSLIWLSVTGALSWWLRRPSGQLGVPPAREVAWSKALLVSLTLMAIVLPIFGLSVIAVVAIGWMLRRHVGLRPA